MENNFWNVIGLMSGTSLDGVDIIYTHISRLDGDYNFKIINAETIPYTAIWEQQLKNAFTATIDIINKLNINYGEYLGECVNEFIKKHKIKSLDFIASHGHTIFHKPDIGCTLQIGDGQTISKITGLKVICDFRTQDVQLGGQGAPLVPIGDELFFSKYNYCLNLGGFANISFRNENKRIAFDICPVNIVMNHYVNKLGFNFDKDGEIASLGEVDKELLLELNNLSFYNSPLPKSLGFEFVKGVIFPIIDNRNIDTSVILRTFVAHIIEQITACFDNVKGSKVLITGGGAFNKFLINELKLQTKNEIIIPEDEIVEYKEALIFAFLGVLRSENQVNCLSSVTGAIKDHCSGEIFIN